MHTLIHRRSWLLGLGASCATWAIQRPADACAALPISLPDLTRLSRFTVVGIAREGTSDWERSSTGNRIVTHTRLEVQQTLDGRDPPDSNLFVRTLGGVVGDVGQLVHGEAELQTDRPAVLFLNETRNGAYGITAMVQGHYALNADDDGTHRLFPHPHVLELVARDPRAAASRLHRRTLPDCARLVLEALESAR